MLPSSGRKLSECLRLTLRLWERGGLASSIANGFEGRKLTVTCDKAGFCHRLAIGVLTRCGCEGIATFHGNKTRIENGKRFQEPCLI